MSDFSEVHSDSKADQDIVERATIREKQTALFDALDKIAHSADVGMGGFSKKNHLRCVALAKEATSNYLK